MGLEKIQGPKAKRQCRSTWQVSGCPLVLTQILIEFGDETGAVGKVIFLSFQPYLERPKRLPYATWASVLV